ncbi:hypothetical protein BK010_02090 [Tenericutes bacterium MO-XQ]|nr:hypothetical protein BK010_02090 [Tenericutes bacterium MO-XQ]
MSFLLSFFKWTICLTQVIWTHTEIDVPVYSDLEDYIEIPKAKLSIDGVLVDDIPSYVRDGVNRTFLSTVVTSYCKTYYIYFEAYFEDYNINEKQLIQINVVDQIKPKITYIPTYQIDVYGEPPDLYQHLIFSDNYDAVEDLDIFIDDQLVNYDIVGTYDIVYLIKDTSGNENRYTRTLEVIDRHPPIQEMINPLIIEVHELLNINDYIDFKDNYDQILNINVIGDEEPFDQLGYYDIKVVAVDRSKNVSEISYILEVVDQTPPDLILVSYPPPLDIFEAFDLEDCYQYVLSYTDNYDELNQDDIKIIYDVDINRVGKYQIYFEISDHSGNKTNKTLSIEVKDQVGPSIEINTPLVFEVFSQKPIIRSLITIDDNYCDDAAIDVDIKEKIDMNKIGFYELTIEASDAYDNKTILYTTIEIIDTIPPEITQVSDILLSDFEEKELSIYFNAYDAYDLDHTIIEVLDHEVDYKKVGVYEITVMAYDQSNNQATLITEVFVVDVEPPVLELTCTELLINLNQIDIDYLSYVNQVSDNYSQLTIYDLIIDSNLDTLNLGKYEITYTLVDQSFNQTTLILTVFVVDQEPPVIEGSNLYKNMFDSVDVMEGIYVSDNVTVYEIYSSIELLDTSYPGSYEVYYVAIDSSGNQSSFSRMIYISETNEPFTLEEFTPIIVIVLVGLSILYYLYKKL